ncbi:hypothetical protein DENSPDRAFT_86744 [Dentipellis sp. KUC8613]|nr:hypothetical protein DENSPDRAFT_86744 [Dentipellis sp. KUC8613]
MAYPYRSRNFPGRDVPKHNSPTQIIAFTCSEVERQFVSDLQLVRTRPASFADSDLANALGNPTTRARDAHDLSDIHVQQTALQRATPAHRERRQSISRSTSSTKSFAPGSSTQRHLGDVIPQGVVFSAGRDYQEQWKAEHQPQPVASSSKAPRILAMNPRALASRKGRSTTAQDLYNLNKRLPDPWHRYDDPLNKRVIPKDAGAQSSGATGNQSGTSGQRKADRTLRICNQDLEHYVALQHYDSSF